MKHLIFILTLLLSAPVVRAVEWPDYKGFKGGDYEKDSVAIVYRYFVPENHKPNYPLVVYLHGRGPRGTNNEAQLGSTQAVIWKEEWFQNKYPCFILAPQTDTNNWVTPEGETAFLPVYYVIEELIEKYKIDRNRIYLTGNSMGGVGTWGVIWHRPDYFAAAIPTAGALADEKYTGIKDNLERINDVPVWAWNCAQDNVVPPDSVRYAYKVLKKHGMKYTELEWTKESPVSRHELPRAIAFTPNGTYPNSTNWVLYDWMFQQSNNSNKQANYEAGLSPGEGRSKHRTIQPGSLDNPNRTCGYVGLRPLPRYKSDLRTNHGGPWAGLPTFDKQNGNYPFVAEHLDIIKGWLDGDFKTKRMFFEHYWGLSEDMDDLDPQKNHLVKKIRYWESRGAVVEHILICREYRLSIQRGHPLAEPGPFMQDTRILFAEDVSDIRALFINGHKQGLLKHDNYNLIQLVEDPIFFSIYRRAQAIIEKMEGVAYEAHQFNRHWPLETGLSEPWKVVFGAKWTLDQGKEYIFYYGPVIWKSKQYYEFIERDWLYKYWKAELPKHHRRMHYYLNTFPNGTGRGRPLGPESDPHSVLGFTKWLIQEIKNDYPNAPVNPQCEFETNPVYVSDASPEFYWVFSDSYSGDTQGAYRILVSTSLELLGADSGTMWDSGKMTLSIESSEYEGSSLISNTTYYWKVMTWDIADSSSPYCTAQSFHMGELMFIKMGWVSDIHGVNVDGTKIGTQSVNLLQYFVNEMNNNFHPDFCIETGDSYNNVDHDTDIAALQAIDNVYDDLVCPRYYTLGNHELWTMTKDEVQSTLGIDYNNCSFDIKNLHCIILDAQFDYFNNPRNVSEIYGDGHIPPAELTWLENDLSSTSKRTIVFIHQPIDEQSLVGNAYFEDAPTVAYTDNGSDVRTILEDSGKVIAVFQGHTHWNKFLVINDISYFTMCSLVDNWTVGQPTGDYAKVIIDEDSIDVYIIGKDSATWHHEYTFSFNPP